MGFTISGGRYNNKDYSCMYHNLEKYCDVSKNEEYYYQIGVEDDSLDDEEQVGAILVFSMEDDFLVYAERFDCSNTDDFQKKIDELETELSFLAETSMGKE